MAFSLMGAMSMSCTTLVSNKYTIVLSTKQKVVCGWKNEANVPNNNNGAEQSPGTCLAKGNTCKQVLWDDRSKQICDVMSGFDLVGTATDGCAPRSRPINRQITLRKKYDLLEFRDCIPVDAQKCNRTMVARVRMAIGC
jgi:hypothetical protein